MNLQNLSRRSFLGLSGIAGAGLLLGFRWNLSAADMLSAETTTTAFAPNAFVHISASGTRLIIPVPEIGQGIRTSLAMVVADSLDADLSTVQLEQAPPDDKYGMQVTGGSNSIRWHYARIGAAAATAREMLKTAAASTWGVPASECQTSKGEVLHPASNRRLGYGELAEAAARLPVPEGIKGKDTGEFVYVGQSTRALDQKDIVTGRIQFGLDARPEGLLHGVCLRPPCNGARLVSFDEKPALALAGVIGVRRLDGDRIGIVARDTWTAQRAAAVIQPQWDLGENAGFNTQNFTRKLLQSVDSPQFDLDQKGDGDSALAQTTKTLTSVCHTPLLAHCTMEPPTCTVHFRDGGVEIWASCQNLGSARRDIPRLTGLSWDNITFHTLRIGGGFGRKLMLDSIEEAILLAKAFDAPVKLTFSREHDLRHDFYRGAFAYKLTAGIDARGKPLVLDYAISGTVGQRSQRIARDFTGIAPHARVRGSSIENPVRHGPLRAPGHNSHNFAYEVFIDELAHLAGHDPMIYRLALYGDPDAMKQLGWSEAAWLQPKLASVLRLARDTIGWKTDPDSAYGVSTFIGYGSHIALAMRMPKKSGRIADGHIVAAVDCGLVINPLGAAAQVEGGILDGLGAALQQKVTLKEGRVQNSNFHDFPLLRINEAPSVECHFVPSTEAPQGLGEVSYPAIAPLISNTLFALDNKRRRVLPFSESQSS